MQDVEGFFLPKGEVCVEIVVPHYCGLAFLSQNFSNNLLRNSRSLACGFLVFTPVDLIFELGLQLVSALPQLVGDLLGLMRFVKCILDLFQLGLLHAEHLQHLVNLLRVHISIT